MENEKLKLEASEMLYRNVKNIDNPNINMLEVIFDGCKANESGILLTNQEKREVLEDVMLKLLADYGRRQ